MKRIAKKLYDLVPMKPILYRVLRKLNLPQSIYKHLHFDGFIAVKIGERAFRMIHGGYQLENNLFWAGLDGWEPPGPRVWAELCIGKKVVMDIGANTGLYALIAKTVSLNADVYAFECVDRITDLLISNARDNFYDIKVIGVAVSNVNGIVKYYDLPETHIYSVTIGKDRSGRKDSYERTTNAMRLDTIIKEHEIPYVDLMKIDVETHEPEVLEGMGVYLGKCRPTMIIEILTNEVAKRVQGILDPLHYKYYDIGKTVRKTDTITSDETPDNAHNYLCMPKEAPTPRTIKELL